MATILGIDYASIDDNAPPNWSLVKQPAADGSTVQFAILRATYGDWIDTTYLRDYSGIKAAGLVRGVYMYPRYRNGQGVQMTPELLVETLLQALKQGGYERGKDLPPAIDIESGGSPTAFGASPEDALKWYERIYELLKADLGIAPMIYTSGRVWTEDLRNLMTEMTDCALWLAKPWPWPLHTTAQRSITQAFANGAYDPVVPIPWGGGNWAISQYQGDAWNYPGVTKVSGTTGQVDCDRFHTIKEGAKGPYVAWCQHRLAVTADGQFGPKTTQAVKTFQAKQCLVADGIIGVRTFALLCWVKLGVY
jgi:peptidoglycan hydrolase-like protein with peptidoglycan-binding domain